MHRGQEAALFTVFWLEWCWFCRPQETHPYLNETKACWIGINKSGKQRPDLSKQYMAPCFCVWPEFRRPALNPLLCFLWVVGACAWLWWFTPVWAQKTACPGLHCTAVFRHSSSTLSVSKYDVLSCCKTYLLFSAHVYPVVWWMMCYQFVKITASSHAGFLSFRHKVFCWKYNIEAVVWFLCQLVVDSILTYLN